MLTWKSSGDFKNLRRFLAKPIAPEIQRILNSYGRQGVAALASATPTLSGFTAAAWRYEVLITRRQYTIRWYNTHVVSGVPIAIILQYGHGTGTGGYVQGRNYINPAIQPVFDKIAEEGWKAVSSL